MDRMERVVLKNARGHVYFEYGEPMLEAPAHVRLLSLESMTATERDDFEGLSEVGSRAPWPEVGSRMMTRLATGEVTAGQGVGGQDGIYRESGQADGGLRRRMVRFAK